MVTFGQLNQLDDTWENSRDALKQQLSALQTQLNAFLNVGHDSDGTLSAAPWVDEAVTAAQVRLRLPDTGWGTDATSQGNIRYVILNKTVCVLTFNIYSFLFSGSTPTFFTMRLPTAFRVKTPGSALYYTGKTAIYDSGKAATNAGGYCQVGGTTPGILTMLRDDLGTFVGGFISIQGTITFEIEP